MGGIFSDGTATAEGWRRAGAVYRRGAEFENQPELRYGRRAGDFEYDAGSVESWGRKLYHRRVQPAKAFGAVWIDGGSEAAYGVAFGYPSHISRIEHVEKDGDIRYHLDVDGNYVVPKRNLEDVVTCI